MKQSPKFKYPHEINRGDIINTPLSNKIGMVYAIENKNGIPTSFDIIPIHIHELKYHGKNNDTNFMLPIAIKHELGLDASKNYQVEFKLEPIVVENVNDFIIRHAQTEKTNFGYETLRRMGVLDFRTSHREIYEETEQKIHTIHNYTPSFIKERLKPSAPTELNITIEDAAKLGLICEHVKNILSYGTYGSGKSITFLREAYRASVSTDYKELRKIEGIFKSGVTATNLTLDDACDTGILKRQNASPKVWERRGITTVAGALDAIQQSGDVVSKINPQVINHIETFPHQTGLPTLLHKAWTDLGTLRLTNDPKLLSSGLPFMYPIHKRG